MEKEKKQPKQQNQKPKKTSRIKTRPLTNSEKFLLSALAIVLFIWLSYNFVLTPQAAKIEELSNSKLEYESKILENNSILRREPEIKEEWDILSTEREEVLSQYFPIIDQPQIIYLLNDLLENEKVDISELSFNQANYDSIGDLQVKQMSVNIPFSGEYSGIKDVIKALGTSPRRIIVDSLNLDRKDSDDLSGNMALKIFSLEDIADADPNIIFVDKAHNFTVDNPFTAYSDYNDFVHGGNGSEAGIGSGIGEGDGIIGDGEYGDDGYLVELSPDIKEGMKKILLEDFETRNYEFIPSHSRVKGSVMPSTIKKSGKHSLRWEYNILAVEEENRAYIDFLNDDMIIKYPPNSIGMWVFSYGYSPGTLGMRLAGQDGEEIDVKITEGIPWMGWNYLEITLPQDLTLYPLKVDKLYFEIANKRSDSGVMLIDKIEAFYPEDKEGYSTAEKVVVRTPLPKIDTSGPEFKSYIVKEGDTVIQISRDFYDSEAYMDEIIRNNGLRDGDLLIAGTTIRLKKR